MALVRGFCGGDVAFLMKKLVSDFLFKQINGDKYEILMILFTSDAIISMIKLRTADIH